MKSSREPVYLNRTYNIFKDIISAVPQGSVVGTILFKAFLNGFFFCIKQASVSSFEEDTHYYPSIAKTFVEVTRTATSESNQ